MRTSTLVLALFVIGSWGLGRVPDAVGQTAGNWVTLFDGKSLDNWVVTGNADWTLANGAVEATKPRGFLVSKQSYGDFELRVDVWGNAESNAGVLFRITNAQDPGIENGYELNINDLRKDQSGRTGSIVNVAAPLAKVDMGNPGRWVTVEIMARGPKMTARIDGILVAEASDAKYARGPVSMQAAGGTVRYRNFQIRELK